MIEAHPENTELVQFAFVDASIGGDHLPRHLALCSDCRGRVDMLRTQADALRLTSIPALDATPDCLDDESITAFAGGSIDPADSLPAVTHLLTCARCREDVASVARLLGASTVRKEIDQLSERPRGVPRRHLQRALVLAGALAAGLTLFLLPGSSKLTKQSYREESITEGPHPRLVAPVGVATPSDTFRWTSVPRADRYRITVFAADGVVLWEKQTRDTAIAFPEVVGRSSVDTLLWRVEAHVGWEDRWASSELTMLTIRRARR